MTDTIGRSDVAYRTSKSILTKASGFIDAFDYTLNPYTGCTFGCTYCYAAFFTRDIERQHTWGAWVDVKENALALLKKKRKRPLIDKAIYISSVTDPYQPIERRLELNRAILEELLTYHQVKVVIQTRGTLVTRDLDLLRQFEHARVNMTITTDDEGIRKTFEPTCPSIQQRLDAIQTVNAAGVEACITMTPLLPLRDPSHFAERLRATGVERFVVQSFHKGNTRFAGGTSDEARQLAERLNWGADDYRASVAVLRAELPHVAEGRAGFIPDW